MSSKFKIALNSFEFLILNFELIGCCGNNLPKVPDFRDLEGKVGE